MNTGSAIGSTGAAHTMDSLPWIGRASALGSPFVTEVRPEAIEGARLLHVNQTLAAELGMNADLIGGEDFLAVMAGNRPLSRPDQAAGLASVYAGHQFGVWVPQLGDGRAMLLGELAGRDGRPLELQLKGSGRTPWSRFADGRAVLRSSLREYLCSTAMRGLGIPTTEALCLVGSDTPVQRETLETAALVCRVAPSFLRFGHYEFYSHHGRHAELRRLVDHGIEHHWPQLLDEPDRIEQWLRDVVRRTARLMAQWQCVGFCHGVMNTDNFSILGLTIDYGPFGFMDGFDGRYICNHSDEGGRYAYDQQPTIGHWNCARLLQALLPLLADDETLAVERANEILGLYGTAYAEAAMSGWRAKLGLREARDEDGDLVNRLLQWMHGCRADFTRVFRALSTVRANPADESGRLALLDEVIDPAGLEAWLVDYRARLRVEGGDEAARATAMNRANPRYVLRNWIAQEAIDHIAQGGSTDQLDLLMRVLAAPFDEHPEAARWDAPPPDWAAGLSVSCSS